MKIRNIALCFVSIDTKKIQQNIIQRHYTVYQVYALRILYYITNFKNLIL